MANENLSPIVMKFGGTSLRDESCRESALTHVKRYAEAGERIVVVVSAMGSSTDELIELASELSKEPSPREMDMLLSAG